MAITLTSNGYIINSGAEVTGSTSKVKTYQRGENSVRQTIPDQSGSSKHMMWEAATNFNKKSSSSLIVIEGQCVGMDEYSHPYGGTLCRVRHSDGTEYDKTVGSVYLPNSSGAHVILWHLTLAYTGSDLGDKTGDFDVFWGYGGNTGGNRPWRQEWNWNHNEDDRAQQQGSHTAIYEIEP